MLEEMILIGSSVSSACVLVVNNNVAVIRLSDLNVMGCSLFILYVM